ncbi:MAG: F0F1 ATP synthase subunit gamma [Alphaproteobacteria bacterium]|nr:MAG: F0F1 ATP synthase subunit gamma [Alphaproteobacteria bacterium]
MASLKELRNRIDSVKNTQKITKAMQMVAAAKLRRAQDAAEAARPYSERMDAVLGNLAAAMATMPGAPALLAGNGKSDRHLLVVATAERGLCGGFNSSISKLARAKALELKAQGKDVKLLCVGKKGYDALKREFRSDIVDVVDLSAVRQLGFNDAHDIGTKLITMFEADEFDVCTIFYNKFESVISQVPTAQQIIPAFFPTADNDEDKTVHVYDYEPDEKAILNDLLPRNVSVQVFKALLENGASEQGARMSAMDNATRNAGEMIDSLTILYNRSRQAQITKELIEIISGAEAL